MRKRNDTKPLTVVSAIVANITIAVAKFIAAAASGSAAMFAEGVHSVVDSLNQGIILLGLSRSNKAADPTHPFGYGKEVYFWTLIYAVLLFGIGGGVSIFKGVTRLSDPSVEGSFTWSYVVLAVAFVAEGTSWVIAVRAVRRKERGRGFFQKLVHSKDPARFVVVGEDSAALMGIVVAAVGILLTQLTGSHYPDAIASMLIGLILCAAAVYLVRQTKALLVGESADPEIVRGILELTERRSDVEHTGPPLTMHLGPRSVLVALDIEFRRDMSASDVAQAVDEIEDEIRERYSQVEKIYIEAQLVGRDVEKEQPA